MNKKNAGLKIMGQKIKTIGEERIEREKQESEENLKSQTKQREEYANNPETKITGKDIWIKLDEILSIINSINHRLIGIEMFFENLQEYINKTGKLEILNKSDEYNQPISKKKETYLDKKE